VAGPNLARKDVLNPKEAAAHFGLSQRRFFALVRREKLEFVAYYGTRRLIIRTELEKYLIKHPEIRSEQRGRAKKR